MGKSKVLFKVAALCTAVMVVVAGCSTNAASNDSATSTTGASTNTGASAAPASGEKVTLKLLLNKTESVESFKVLEKEYETEFPNVDLQIDLTMGSEFGAALKTRFASGQGPDIFSSAGYKDFELWSERVEDLSAEPWVSDVVDGASDGASIDGKLYGFPLSIDGYGFMYNKDLFAKAGITELPTTFTALKEVVSKLKAADIAPFITPFGEWYTPGVFEANNPVAKQVDPDQFFADLSSGAITIPKAPLFDDWLNLFELEFKNAHKEPLSIDYMTMVTDFANGEGAITNGCGCSQPLVLAANPDINVGVMPMPINDDAALNDKIFVGVSTYLLVNKDSKVKDAAKAFLTWLSSSKEGQRLITEEFAYIPAFKSMPSNAEKLGPLGTDIKKYIDEGKTLGLEYNKYPEGLSTEWGSTLQKWVAGEINRTQVLEEFQASWVKLDK